MFDFTLQPGRELKKVKHFDYKPLITIVTSFYSGALYIEQTAKSILNQSFPYFEWIIVNDGVNDKKSLELLKKIKGYDNRIKIFNKKNEGVSIARDYGARKANKQSKYLVFLDDDDLIDNTYLEMLYYTLEINKSASWAYTDVVNFDKYNSLWKKPFNSNLLKKENFLVLTAMIRKEAFFAVNGFDIKQKNVYEDWNLWLKLISKGMRPIHVSTNSFWYRKKCDGEFVRAKNNDNALKIIKETVSLINDVEVNPIEFPQECYNWERIDTNKVDIPSYDNKDKINLLFIFPWMVVGGADKFNIDLINSLDKNKYSVTIVTTQQTEYKWRQKFENICDNLFELPSFLDRKDWPAFLEYIIKSRNINIVFNSNSQVGYSLLPYIKCLFPNVAILDYIHMEEWYNRGGGYSRDSSAVASVIDKTYLCNSNSEKILISYFGRDKNKLETVYIGVDTEMYDPAQYNKNELLKKYNIPADVTVIGLVARIDYQKRPYLLMEIIKKLLKDDEKLFFLIAGDGPLLKPIIKLAKKYKIDNYINFVGQTNKSAEIYIASDITLNCSIKEGLALTSYESLALGIPVVSCDVGGQKELINDKVGVIVPCVQKEEEVYNFNYTDYEIDNYVEGIKKVKNNLDYYKNNCRLHVVKNFNIKNMYAKFDYEFTNIYKKYCQKKKDIKILPENTDIARELYVQSLLATRDLYNYFVNDYNLNVYGRNFLLKKKNKNSRLVDNYNYFERVAGKFHLANEYYLVCGWLVNFGMFLKSLYKCTIGFVLNFIKLEVRRFVQKVKKVFREE